MSFSYFNEKKYIDNEIIFSFSIGSIYLVENLLLKILIKSFSFWKKDNLFQLIKIEQYQSAEIICFFE